MYDRSTSPDPVLSGVDNVTVAASGDIFVCEDGGDMEIVMLTPEGTVAPFLRLDVSGSELTGVAFDPSGTRMYFSSQRNPGTTFEITGPFRGAPPCPASDFSDVPSGSYFDRATDWAVCNGITIGTSATTFSPHEPVTQAQFATLLWRYAGEPVGLAHSFSDVAPGSPFDAAVGWMSTTGITTGTSPTTFSPDATVTRADVATSLWRYIGRPRGFAHSFTDASPGEAFADAVAWMSAQGITNGFTASTFGSGEPATRAHIVTFLWRLAGEP